MFYANLHDCECVPHEFCCDHGVCSSCYQCSMSMVYVGIREAAGVGIMKNIPLDEYFRNMSMQFGNDLDCVFLYFRED